MILLYIILCILKKLREGQQVYIYGSLYQLSYFLLLVLFIASCSFLLSSVAIYLHQYSFFPTCLLCVTTTLHVIFLLFLLVLLVVIIELPASS